MAYAHTQPAWQSGSLETFFSEVLTFRGRMNRARYWLSVFVLLCGYALVAIVFAAAAVTQQQAVMVLFGIAGFAAAVALMVLNYFIAIRRLHDRDKSGHWLWLFCLAPGVLNGLGNAIASQGSPQLAFAIMLVGIGISMWGFVEIGCLPGTAGSNRFGPDRLRASARA